MPWRRLRWIRVTSDKSLDFLASGLRKLPAYNAWDGAERVDKNGFHISFVYMDWNPGDGSTKPEAVLGVWFQNGELAQAAQAVFEANRHDSIDGPRASANWPDDRYNTPEGET